MYLRTIRGLLELSPSGLTNDQMLWRLRRSGIRLSADEIMQVLTALVNTGVAQMSDTGRWRLAHFERRPPGQGGNGTKRTAPLDVGGRVLWAVTAIVSTRAPAEPPAFAAGEVDTHWRKLLAYYAATQRIDPRGRVDERADQHSVSWQLLRADGCWWEGHDLRFATGELPESFREALMRRPAAACSVGYPVCVFSQADVPSFVPALLLPAAYRLDGHELVVEIATSDPVLNPLWLDLAVRRSRWRKDQLVEALFPEGEDQAFGDVVMRLGNSLATLGGGHLRPGQLAGEMTIEGDGFRNTAGLFLASDARFTQGAERDLDEMQDWPEAAVRETALWSLLAPQAALANRDAVLQAPDVVTPTGPKVLTDRQYDAAVSALRGPLTLIQGPPGTGKSEVILSLLTSIVLSGRSVIVASKNHQALDEVEARLGRLVEDAPLLTRGRDVDGERDTNFVAQMRLLADGDIRPDQTHDTDASAASLEHSRELLNLWADRQRLIDLNLKLSEAAEKLSRWNETEQPSVARYTGFIGALRWLAGAASRLVRRGRGTSHETREQADQKVRKLRRELAALPAEPAAERLDSLAETIARAVTSTLGQAAQRLTTPTLADKQILADRVAEMAFHGGAAVRRLTAEDARLVVRYRPIWALSTLSAASRVPLVPALFDYVIFDEASQCDIASALPLFGRARKAVIVGDPMQLGFIPQLSNRQEHALMDASGIGATGRHTIAQSVNSLFDFAMRRKLKHWHFLADQFRSAPEIVGYLNDAFYQGRLVASRDERTMRWPDGYRPGIAWVDVRGRTTREDGGNVNHPEADEIIRILTTMVRERGFTGTIGVLSPFNTQVALLMRRTRAALTEAERDSVELRVSTIDKFQGGEADVIVFSPVVAPGAQQGALTFYERERRRLNVAISRARALCLVVGDKDFVRQSRVRTLSFLLEASERAPKPRQYFDSEWERRLDAGLKRRGLEAFPQYPVGSRYLDFALDPEGRKLDVEVDGRRDHADPDGNRKVSDRLRDRELIARGWTVRRFWVHELADDMEKCLDIIGRDLGGA